jgi:hypothetical protein
MITDIRVVSTLLPYCDGMFVDNFCRSILSEIPTKHKLPHKTLVFSSKTLGDFLQYLHGIRTSAKQEHLLLMFEVYGSKALQPPKSIYGVGLRKSDC